MRYSSAATTTAYMMAGVVKRQRWRRFRRNDMVSVSCGCRREGAWEGKISSVPRECFVPGISRGVFLL